VEERLPLQQPRRVDVHGPLQGQARRRRERDENLLMGHRRSLARREAGQRVIRRKGESGGCCDDMMYERYSAHENHSSKSHAEAIRLVPLHV
jgi:hypothetical protein